MATGERRERVIRSLGLILVFVALAAGIVASGYYYYRNYERYFRSEVERQLSAVAELKVDNLVRWRRERLADAGTIFRNPAFSELARRFLEQPRDAGARRALQIWLAKLKTIPDYERVFLLDSAAAIRLSAPETPAPVIPHLARDVSAALSSGRIEFLDFHRDMPDGSIHLVVLVPLFDERDGRRPLGAVAFRIDPGRYLYPMIEKWPTPSRTAETLLVRLDGNDALFLNELRFMKNTALNLRFSLEKKDVPAVQAALGRTGYMEGHDYRGVPVAADLRAVPESPWFLVSRVDIAEVYAPLRERFWLTVLIIGALLITAAAGMVIIRWRQRVRFFRDRVMAAEALRASEVQYRRFFESAQDAILILDGETGLILDVNPFLIELLGYSHEEFLDKKVWELGFLKDIVANQAHFAELQRKGYIRYENMPLETAAGRRIEVEFISKLYLVDDRKMIQCNIRDLTERNKAVEELRESVLELRKRNDELMRFTYTVSHDLKSPLVTIKAFLGYLEKDTREADAEAMVRDLGFIHGAADRMSRLLDELLELSRVGRIMNPSVDVPLQEVVQEVLDLAAGRIAERGVVVEVTGEPVILYGDRMRLLEVFQNLVDNAVKFMGDQPAPRVEIGADHAGDETVIFVRDNGIGIDPRHQSKLFGLFEQLDPGAEGTGIGLALVKRIVEVHGGRIWIESGGAGKGTTIRFTLPGKDGV